MHAAPHTKPEISSKSTATVMRHTTRDRVLAMFPRSRGRNSRMEGSNEGHPGRGGGGLRELIMRHSSPTSSQEEVDKTRHGSDKNKYKMTLESRQVQSSRDAHNMKTSALFILALFVFALVRSTFALVGYDCGGSTLNITTFSTIDQSRCDYTSESPIHQDLQIQLLQMVVYNDANVLLCKVEVDRTIYYCGMHLHSSVVSNGRQQYILATPREVFKTMHEYGILFLSPSTQISGLLSNTTTSRSVTLAGSIQQDGTCGGTTYSDPFGPWDNVIAQAIIRITLKERQGSVKLANNEIILPSGQHCALSREYCLDTEDGYFYWTSIPSSQCKFNEFDVLYEGKGVKTTTRNGSTPVYTVTSGDTAFALTNTGHTVVCGYTLSKTEHPKLLIVETDKEGKFKTEKKTRLTNIDIFSYINTKFVYTEKHIKGQIVSMYRGIMRQKCEVERQVLKNALALINTSPAEVATTLAKEPGYMAIQSGEVIHIIKCIPIQVTVRKISDCYDELPVLHRNESYFITPRHRILTRIGTKRDCNELIAPTYRIHGTWYRMTPHPVETVPPIPLQPLTESAWQYTNPANLANGGIYSQDEIRPLAEHIMFPVEKAAVINSIAQGASGRTYASESVKMYNLLDEDTLTKIAETTREKLWEGFVEFGSAMAGIIGIYTTVKVIKMCINTILNGFALHNAYGCGIQLLAESWSALTNFCLFLKDRSAASESPVSLRECVPDSAMNTEVTSETGKELSELVVDKQKQFVSYRRMPGINNEEK